MSGASAGERWRTYVAVPLPALVALRLEARLAPFRATYPAARWGDPNDAHLTLVFLGGVPGTVVPAVLATMVDLAALRSSFRLALGGAGSFGGHTRPRVAWLGVARGQAELMALASALRSRLETLPGLPSLGAAGGLRPHLTVARRAPATLMPALLAEFRAEGPAWTVREFVLYRSHLDPGGARHEALGAARLDSRGPDP